MKGGGELILMVLSFPNTRGHGGRQRVRGDEHQHHADANQILRAGVHAPAYGQSSEFCDDRGEIVPRRNR